MLTIEELLNVLNLVSGIRVLVKTKFHNQNIPIGGGSVELIKKKFGKLEVLSTSITENRNLCFLCAFFGRISAITNSLNFRLTNSVRYAQTVRYNGNSLTNSINKKVGRYVVSYRLTFYLLDIVSFFGTISLCSFSNSCIYFFSIYSSSLLSERSSNSAIVCNLSRIIWSVLNVNIGFLDGILYSFKKVLAK